MTQTHVTGTDIRIVNEIDRGRFKQALFDFDGTVSLLREGWQKVMAPLMEECIAGDAPVTDELKRDVENFVADSTGINTILQMESLVEMVKERGLVPNDRILDPYGYKDIYNDRLMKNVNKRIADLKSGALKGEDATVRGSIGFLKTTA